MSYLTSKLQTLTTILPFIAIPLMLTGFMLKAVPALTHGVLFS